MSTVLIVDDSAVDRNLVAGLLADLPELKVEFAVNGQEAWETIGRSSPDLVLTDLIMPEMDGLELVAKIVSECSNIPVILITGQGSEETAVQALKTGAAGYVPKRMLADLLVPTVQQVFEAAQEEKCENRVMECLACSDMTFQLGNEPGMVGPFVNYLYRLVRAVGLCDQTNGIRVSVALEEALNNALVHGNLEINSELRGSGPDVYRNLVKQRLQSDPFSSRSIHVRARITPASGTFVVRDEGPGFDPQTHPDPTDPANIEKLSGRGLLLMHTFMDSVEFNTMGNEVTMIKNR